MDRTRLLDHHTPPKVPLWKGFTFRQPHIYPSHESRLFIKDNESVIEAFLEFFRNELEPPRRHEALRSFLERSGACKLNDLENILSADRSLLAMVDDRCDPCITLKIPENTSILLRPWDSDHYNMYPPKGESDHIYGADAINLYKQLKSPVSVQRPKF